MASKPIVSAKNHSRTKNSTFKNPLSNEIVVSVPREEIEQLNRQEIAQFVKDFSEQSKNEVVINAANICLQHANSEDYVEIIEELKTLSAKVEYPLYLNEFLNAVCDNGLSLDKICEQIGEQKFKINIWFKTNGFFKIWWSIIKNMQANRLSTLEDIAYQRAKESSDSLLMFLIKKIDPSYRDSSTNNLAVNVNANSYQIEQIVPDFVLNSEIIEED